MLIESISKNYSLRSIYSVVEKEGAFTEEETEKLYLEVEQLSSELESIIGNHIEVKEALMHYLHVCGYDSIEELVLKYQETQVVTLPKLELEGILNLEVNKPRILERLLVFARLNPKNDVPLPSPDQPPKDLSSNDPWSNPDIKLPSVDTGIEDYAENLNHYLYGLPKKS